MYLFVLSADNPGLPVRDGQHRGQTGFAADQHGKLEGRPSALLEGAGPTFRQPGARNPHRPHWIPNPPFSWLHITPCNFLE